MKLIHTTTERQFFLGDALSIEMERTNPFFSEYGETSIPFQLPDHPTNQALLSRANQVAITHKVTRPIPVSVVSDQGYTVQGLLHVLGYADHQFDVSLTLNDGSFYSQIQDVYCADIFAPDQSINDIDTVADAMAYCSQLVGHLNDPYCCIFPTVVSDDEQQVVVNDYGYHLPNGTFSPISVPLPDAITPLSTGFRFQFPPADPEAYTQYSHISPYLKANYLLQHIFGYFGYTLDNTFLEQTLPFANMVFTNNCIDPLLSGHLYFRDLVPACHISDILDFYRYKFGVQFIINDTTKTAEVQFFKDLYYQNKGIDITPFVKDDVQISYPKEGYQQLILSTANAVDQSAATSNSYAKLKAQYPALYFNPATATFQVPVFRIVNHAVASIQPLLQLYADNDNIASTAFPYYAGGNKKTIAFESPDTMPQILYYSFLSPYDASTHTILSDHFTRLHLGTGGYRYTEPDKPKAITSPLIAALAFVPDTSTVGHLSVATPDDIAYYNAYYLDRLFPSYEPPSLGSICYYGAQGLFSTFFRELDLFYRNSAHQITLTALLTAELFHRIRVTDIIFYQSQRFLIQSMHYSLSDDHYLVTFSLLSLKLHQPVDTDRVPYLPATYRWQLRTSVQMLTKSQYLASPYKDISESDIVFRPLVPSANTADQPHYTTHFFASIPDDLPASQTEFPLVTAQLFAVPIS